MTNESKRILTLIQALLAKTVARGATPEEAAGAAAKAQELLFKYNLALADVELLEGKAAEAEYGREDVELLAKGKFHVSWHRQLLAGIARHNFCRVVILTAFNTGKNEAERCAVVGKSHNIEVVKWLYAHVATQIREMSLVAMRIHCGDLLPGPQGAWTRAFCFGAVRTVLNRLYQQLQQSASASPQSTALVHVTDAQLGQAVTRYFGKTSKVGARGARVADSAAWGRWVSLNRPVGAGATRLVLGR